MSGKLGVFFSQLDLNLFVNNWSWLAAGLGIGFTALALAWFMGKRLGVTGGFVDACSLVTGSVSSNWKIWFILGLPLGGVLATIGHWNWTLTYGRLDALTYGNIYFKAVWLFLSGILIGFGARWAGGCTSGNSIMGVALGSKMSIIATIIFIAAGVLITNIIFKVVM
jgi:uncharacterized membrane protein YedE/YeeE